ncbi:MAG: hypothetical protein ABUT20_46015 [Bacteroidota bacterium]
MTARTFISLMLLLLAFTTALLVFASPSKQEKQRKDCPAIDSRTNDESRVQAEGSSMIWESVSRHLLSAVQ